MVVGILVWELEVYGCHSLKEKRSVVRSLKERLRNKFNLSVAETGHNDLWQRAEISACVVSNDRRQADAILESADRFVVSDPRARVIRADRTFV
jgi:uncharacterized protein